MPIPKLFLSRHSIIQEIETSYETDFTEFAEMVDNFMLFHLIHNDDYAFTRGRSAKVICQMPRGNEPMSFRMLPKHPLVKLSFFCLQSP